MDNLSFSVYYCQGEQYVEKGGGISLMNAQTDKLSIFDYTDYRKYLSDYYAFQKVKNPAFSYRYFARRAGISSSGFYKELIDGKRGLSRALIIRFSQAIRHTQKEADYFENMVYFNEAKTVEERVLYFKKMMSSYEAKSSTLLPEQYEYFSRWYYTVVREMLAVLPFKDDYKALAGALRPPIREDQAKKSIAILKKLNLIKKNEKGLYIPCSPVLTTGSLSGSPAVNAMNIVNFQKEMLKLAATAYDRYPMIKIDLSTLTLSVSEQTFTMMKEELANFRKRLLSMAEKDENPDRVYQLCYNLFPVSKV
jgi:uncharacterized protein (TIGR02147 family)